MPRRLAGLCAAVAAGGCTFGGGWLPNIRPESFPPEGIAFLRYEAPSFPWELRPTAIGSGYSVVVVTVGTDGRVEDAIAIEASDDAFGRAVVEVTPRWVFAPVESATEPRREVLHYRFNRDGVISSLSHMDGARAAFGASNDDPRFMRMSTWNELDEPPRRVDANTSAAASVAGAAELSFVIDTAGRVRVPTVVGASDGAIGLAALAAIKQWQFAPPLRGGKPVLVEVRARWGE